MDGCSVSRDLQERDDSGDAEVKKSLGKRVEASIELGDQILLSAPDGNSATFNPPNGCRSRREEKSCSS